jgi:aminoacyl-tRNA hydrolase
MQNICIIGLGNPDKYSNTRHNYGRDFVIWLSNQLSLPFCSKKNCKYFIKNLNENSDCMFAVCNSFMNETGLYIDEAVNFAKKATDIIIVHDDLEVEFGTAIIRNNANRGIRGHNGIRSIVERLNRESKFRDKKLPYFLSLGIGRPNDLKTEIGDYVLEKFNESEKIKLHDVYESSYNKVVEFITSLNK